MSIPESGVSPLIGSKVIAVDLETTGLDVHRSLICVIALSNGEEHRVYPCYQGQIPDEARAILNQAETWIGHNSTRFDLQILRKEGVVWPANHYDTLIGELIFATEGDRKDFPADLSSTMLRRIGEDNKGKVNHQEWSLIHPPTPEQEAYVKADVASLHNIMLQQVADARQQGFSEALEKEQRLTLITAQVMWNGLPIDYQVLKRHLADLRDEGLEYQARCARLFYPGFNPKSAKQVVAALNEKGIRVPASDVHTLMYEAVEADWKRDLIEPILKARRAAGLISKYNLEKLDKVSYQGRLYGTFNQVGAGTARYTSKDPNLQQIPVKMRDIIGGEEGCLVVAPDYSQIEVRIKALVARDTKLVATLQADDFHREMARMMFPNREITPELRQQGKGGTFTLNFAGGKRGIQRAAIEYGELITDQDANRMIRNYRKSFPISEAFHQQFRQICQKGSARINLPWGHYRTYLKPTPQQMINNIVQGFAAVGYKEGLLEADRRGLTPYIGCLLHDEVIGTGVPPAYEPDFSRELCEAMQVGMVNLIEEWSDGFEVPIVVDNKVGSHWSK